LLLFKFEGTLSFNLLAFDLLLSRDSHDASAIFVQSEVHPDQTPEVTIYHSLSGSLSKLGQKYLLDVELDCVNVEQRAEVPEVVLRYFGRGPVQSCVEGSSDFGLVLVESFKQLFIFSGLFHARPHERDFLVYRDLFGRADSHRVIRVESGSPLQGGPIELI
jgi:hypothetical protein